ncbi:hypothetical protein KK2020170_23320 [Flavobacterium okayamense]|uniref:PKD domain-containing protein n=2 Tax=Flavobacterium okayamense TaxID=2830782 RepID=A0ABM7S7I5_9FLAO|nr:hypothetical protein KK2020170_23320 [Flavobacterium okayamense]
MPTGTGTASYSTCSGTFRDGAGNYANNQDSSVTFCPSTPGTVVAITFTAFNTEDGFDYLEIWQGNSMTGPADDVLMGTPPVPFTVFSTSPDGCLTFHFVSDSGTSFAGWTSTIACSTPCTPPVAQMADNSTVNICSPNAVNPGSLTVAFDASPSYSPVGNPITSYIWDWNDGTTTTTASPTTTHTFPGIGVYNVSLKVQDNNPLGCANTNSETRVVRVLPDADFTGTTTGPININCGDNVNLTGIATSQTITQQAPSVSGSPVSLPDGSGSSYTSTLDFTGLFPVGATLNAGCYPTLTFDLEHSYSGDLEITLISPTGQSVIVYDQHGGGTNFGTCSNGADDGVPGCTATYTVVNSGGISWTAAAATTTATSTCANWTGACETGNNYIPQTYNSTNSFAVLNGSDLNGVWTLQITDNLTWDDGFISGWSLTFPAACYGTVEFVTPDITDLTWSTVSPSAPSLPTQTTTTTVVVDPGPDTCPVTGTCTGTQLNNSPTVGPFNDLGSFTYTVTATDEFGCQFTRDVVINVAPQCATANISYVGNPFCENSALGNVTLTGTGGFTGGTFSATPAGLSINPTTGQIDPSTSTTGITYTVTYTIPASACCATVVTTTTTVIVNAQPNAGTDGNTTVCDSSTSTIDLFSLITGEQSGGVWTQTSGTGGTFNAGAGNYTPAPGATTSTFTYTIAGVAPCIDDSSVATININAQPNAGTDGSTTVCDSSTATIDLFSLITGEQSGGVWTQTSGTGGVFNAGAGTYTPAPGATTSTFTYTIAGVAPCIDDSSVATININAQPNAGTDGSTTVCDSSTAAIDLFSLITGEQSGGVWTQTSGTGGTFNAGAGTYTPAPGATTSTFTYTIAGVAPCIDDSSVATININAQPNAGTDGSTTVCDSSTATIDLFSLITGEQSGGVWTQTSGTGGVFNAGAGTYTPAPGATTSTFTYTIAGVAPCIDDSSVATININAQPNAGTDGNTTVCDSSTATIDLFSLITGEQSGGVWTQTSGTGGTFNAGAGTYTPAPGATTSTFTYTIAGVAPCIDDSSVATININPLLSPVISCGVLTSTSVEFNWAAVTGATSYTISYQINSNPVVNVGDVGNVLNYVVSGLVPADSVLITVTPVGGAGTCFTFTNQTCVSNNCTPPTASISYSSPFCNSNSTLQNVTLNGTGVYTGGSYSAPTGLSINVANGDIDPSISTVGTYTVTYTIPATPGCSPVVTTTSVTINAQPNAGTDGNTTVCDSSTAAIDLFSLITGEQSGGVWTQTSGTGGTFNAGAGTYTPAPGATTSTFTYTIAGVAPCIDDSSVATININAQPNAGTDGSTTVCDSSTAAIDLFSLITGEQSGGVWTQTSGTGGTFNAGAGTYTPAPGATTSMFTYTIAGVAPCIDDSSVATININAQPNAGTDGSTTVCDSSTATIDLFSLITGEQSGGVWTQTSGTGGVFNAGAGTYTPAPGATTSTFTYTIAGVAPCIDDSSVATININAQPNAGTDGNTTVCDSSTATIDLFSLITGEQSGGVWTQTSGTGGTFNAGAGTYTPAPGATTSTFTYTIAGVAPCIDDSSVATININAQPNAGTDGSTTVCDSSTAAIDLFSLITGEQSGGVWTQTSGTGGTFNAGAGTYTPAPGATTSMFTYTIAGVAPCIDDSSVATININAQPNAGTDGSTTVCDSSTATIDLFSLITGEQSGGVWTQTSGTGGTFNAGAGTYTPAPGATTSTFTYTIAGVAPCIDDSSVATININAQPNAGTDGNTTVCDSSTATIDLFSLITGEQSGGVWTQTSGTGGTFNAGAGTYTPAPGATTSTFTYTIAGVAPCIDDSSVATININAQPNAGTDGSTTVCDSSTATIDLFSLITGEQSGGVWTQTSGTGGTFNAGAGTYTPAPGATTSTFTYTIAGVAPCIDDSSVATININAQPNAGTDGNTTVCDSSTAAIDLFSLITGEQSGGVWTQTSGTGGTFNAGAGNYTPAPGATTSTFMYTIAGVAPCVDDSSVVTITINAQPNAGTDGSTTVCDSSTAAIDLFSLITGEQSGGVWTQTSGTGGTFNAGAGTYTPAPGATTSTFTYTIAGVAPCIDDSSVATININAQPNAGTDGSTTVCDSSTASIDLFSLITGEQSGGVWTQTSGTGGTFNAGAGTYTPAPGATTSTFTYTIAGVAPCIDDSSVATININAQPNAGTDGNTTVCDNSSATIDLFSLITGEQSGGVWTQTSGTGGVFNAGAGTYTPAPGATTSTFEYIIAGVAPCVDDSSVATVNIDPYLSATISYPLLSYCVSHGTVDIVFVGTGVNGTYTSVPAGLDINISTGQINTQNSTPGFYTINYLVPTNGACSSYTVSTTIEITARPVLTINNPLPITLCDGEFLHVDWTSNVAGTTLTYTASSNNVTYPSNGDQSTLDQVLSLINSDQIGDITITITPFANGCSGDAIQVPVRINPNPVISSVSVDQNTICSGNEVTFTVTSNLGGTTYDWSVINNTGVTVVGGVTSGTITTGTLMLVLENSTPGLSGTIEVDFTPYRDGCPGATVVSEVITVNPIPGVPNGLPEYYICDGEATPMSITSDPFVAGTELIYDVVDYYNVTGYSSGGPLPEPLLIEDVLTLTDSYVQGYVVYRIWATLNGCDGEYRDFTVYVNPNPQPVLTDGAICVNDIGTVFQTYWLTVEGLPGTNYQYTWYESSDPVNPIAITGVPSLEVAVAGSYYVVVRDLSSTDTSCEGTSNTVSVIETNPATSFITTVTDAFSDNATVVVTVTGGNGMLLYQIDGGAFQESNVFTGVSAGEHVITVIDSQGCTYLQETVLVIDYPNFFTPNGDGYNDTWNIIGLNQPEAKLYIFDRYGKLIKQLSTVGPGWDGTYNGEQLPSTDYWFSLEYLENGVAKEFKAHFAMKR